MLNKNRTQVQKNIKNYLETPEGFEKIISSRKEYETGGYIAISNNNFSVTDVHVFEGTYEHDLEQIIPILEEMTNCKHFDTFCGIRDIITTSGVFEDFCSTVLQSSGSDSSEGMFASSLSLTLNTIRSISEGRFQDAKELIKHVMVIGCSFYVAKNKSDLVEMSGDNLAVPFHHHQMIFGKSVGGPSKADLSCGWRYRVVFEEQPSQLVVHPIVYNKKLNTFAIKI